MGKNREADVEARIQAGLAVAERFITIPTVYEMLQRAKAPRSIQRIQLDAARGKLRTKKVGNMQITVVEEGQRYTAACIAERKPHEPLSNAARAAVDRIERDAQP